MTLVKVAGGTGAGRKLSKREPRADWRCSNDHDNRGYVTRCMVAGCNEKRPSS